MESGILLTIPTGGGDSSSSIAIEDTILPGDIETIDTCDCDPCPAIKWLVTARNTTSDETKTLEVNAVHDFSGNVDYNCHSILGSDLPIEVTAVAGPGANDISLIIENTSLVDTIDICAFRIVQ